MSSANVNISISYLWEVTGDREKTFVITGEPMLLEGLQATVMEKDPT